MAVAFAQRVGMTPQVTNTPVTKAPVSVALAAVAASQTPPKAKGIPADEYKPGLGLKFENAGRTLKIAVHEFFGGHTIDNPQSLQKPWQRTLHKVFPGGLVTAAFSKFEPDPAGAAIPSGPLTQAVDARQWLPLVHFEKGEQTFPTDPGFDGNANVKDNPETYRRGKTDGNQEPTFYVSASTVGEYTVLRYDVYYVDNRYMNYHPHDWEGFSVYLKPDDKGQLKPAYLMTSWHYDNILTPWSELQFDESGKPTILVDIGGHGSRPLKRGMAIPEGKVLHPQGYWTDDKGTTATPQTIHLKGDTPKLKGVEPVKPLADGQDPRAIKYPAGDWILGFIRLGSTVEVGPKSRPTWLKPYHPLAFGVTGTAKPGAATKGS